MGILSEERYDEMVAKFEAVASGEEQPEVSAQADEPQQSDDSQDSNQEEDGSSADAADVKEEVETQADSSEPDAPKTPEHIPYGRFKEVNDKFRAREDDLQQAMQRIRDLEQLTLAQAKQPQAETEKAPSKDDEWLNEIFGDHEDPSAQAFKQIRQEVHSVKEWQQQRTEQLVASQLDAEIKAAAEKNPDVKVEELWQAVAANGSVDVNEAAEYIQQHRATMREQYLSEASSEIEALKAKLAEAEKVAAEAPKFRRPSATSAAPGQTEQRSRTVSEATNAFAEAIRERMSH